MSWLDKINTDFVITCGDGSSYTALWMNASKAKEYNVAEFEFPELDGTLVRRGRAKGRRYNLELFFQGEDHLEQSESFEASADNPGAWTISHPLYGSILVQPLGLVFDNEAMNVTRIRGQVVETITEDAPKSTVHVEDKIAEQKEVADEALCQSVVKDVPAPKVADKQLMKTSVQSLYDKGVKAVRTNLDFEEYFNAFNKANSAITLATSLPLEAMRKIQAVISYPAQFEDLVKNRLNTLTGQYDKLRESLGTIITRASKKIFEHNAGTIISSLALTTVTNASYDTRKEAVAAVETLLDKYNQYLADLDGLQSANGGTPDSYMPDADALMALSELVSTATSNLFNLAAGAKQERTLYLPEAIDPIQLAHKLYGLQPDDSTIDYLITTNGIGPNELLLLPKGRKIMYYV